MNNTEAERRTDREAGYAKIAENNNIMLHTTYNASQAQREVERRTDREAALEILQANRKPLLDASNAAQAASQADPRNAALAEAAETARYKYRLSAPLGEDINNMITMIRNERLGIIPGKSAAKIPQGERGGRRYISKKHRKSIKSKRSRRTKMTKRYRRR